MTIPRAMIGSATDGRIILLNEGHQDDGEPIPLRVTGNPCAPGGAANECYFHRVYVTVTHTARIHLRCTPIINREHVPEAAFDIELPPTPERRSYTHEEDLGAVSAYGNYVEGLRGRWFQLEINSVGGVHSGDTIIDQVALDYLPVSPTRPTE